MSAVEPINPKKYRPRFEIELHHPLNPHGRSFVVVHNPSLMSDREAKKKWASKLAVPQEFEDDELQRLGLTELIPKDAVFVRMKGCADRTHDILKAFIIDERIQDPEVRAEYADATERILGPKDLRGPRKPEILSIDNGGDINALVGGTHFERYPERHHSNTQGSRCYANAMTLESGTSTAQPSPNLKELGNSQDEGLLDRQFINMAVSKAHGRVIDYCVDDQRKSLLRRRSEAFNSPTYGVQACPWFTGLQINVSSPTTQADFASLSKLASDLGDAGRGHADTEDCAAGLTVMSVGSQLRPGVHPGLFHFLEFGFYTRLTPGAAITFSGLHQHGGTAPIVPNGMPMDDADIRLTLISYPTRHILDRDGCCPLYATNGGTAVSGSHYSSSHIDTGLFDPDNALPIAHRSTFAREGKYCMDTRTHELFMKREQYAARLAEARQAGFSKMLSEIPSFDQMGTYEDGRPLEPWVLGPTGNQLERVAAIAELHTVRLRSAISTPLMWGNKVNGRAVGGIPEGVGPSFPSLPANVFDPCQAHVVRPNSSLNLGAVSEDDAEIQGGTYQSEPAAGSDRLRRPYRPLVFPGSLAIIQPGGSSKRPAVDDAVASQPPAKKPKRAPRTSKGKRKRGKGGKEKGRGGHARRGTLAIRRSERSMGQSKAYADYASDSENEDESPSDRNETLDSVVMGGAYDYRRPARKASVFEQLTVATVEQAARDCHRDLSALMKRHCADPSNLGLHKIRKDTEHLRTGMMEMRDPLVAEHAQHLFKIWGAVKEVTSWTCRMKFATFRTRRLIMLSVYGLWKWISIISPVIQTTVKNIVLRNSGTAPGPSEYAWLVDLVGRVYHFHILHARDVHVLRLDRSHFFSNTPSRVYEVYRQRSSPGDESETQDQVTTIVRDTLIHWMEFPTRMVKGATVHSYGNWELQAQYTHAILERFPDDRILLLEAVWNSFISVHASVVCAVSDDEDVVSEDDWLDRLGKHLDGLALDPRVHRALNVVDKACEETDTQNLGTQTQHFGEFGDEEMGSNNLINQASTEVAAFLHSLAPLIRKDPAAVDGFTLAKDPVGDNPLIRFVLGQDISDSLKQRKHLDHHIPQREFAPTRQAMRHLSKNIMKTAAGFFTALSIRCITYGTSFPFRAKKIFASLSEFQEEVATVRNGFTKATSESQKDLETLHVCTTTAYSANPNATRKTTYDKELWAAARKWEECWRKGSDGWKTVASQKDEFGKEILTGRHVQGRNVMSWDDAMAWMVAEKVPQMATPGTLTGYLFVVDLVYADLVESPTPTQVGQAAFEMDKGALHFLRDHWLCAAKPAKSSPSHGFIEKQARDAFANVYPKVRHLLGADDGPEADSYRWLNPMTFEHTLCKFGRVKKAMGSRFKFSQDLLSTFKNMLAEPESAQDLDLLEQVLPV